MRRCAKTVDKTQFESRAHIVSSGIVRELKHIRLYYQFVFGLLFI